MSKVIRKGNAEGKVRVGIVNYLNTRPLLYGLEKQPFAGQIELIKDYPSNLAQLLINGDLDVGLVPIAIIPQLQHPKIIGNHCIATEGEIASVALFSEVPVHKIEKVYLDYQSRTSVELLKYLMRESWGISPIMIQAEGEEYRNEIKGTSAGLVIGDRAFEQRKISNFIYDLGSEWKAITGLPFVFACWISNQDLPEDFIKSFDQANSIGINHIDEIVIHEAFELYDLGKYYKLHLSYSLDSKKLTAMDKFLQVIAV